MKNHTGENLTQMFFNLSVACKDLLDVRRKQILVIFGCSIASKIEKINF